MIKSSLIEEAREFAITAHEGQFRRDGVTPYFNHCEAVALKVKEMFGDRVTFQQLEILIAVAYLHDVVEDTRYDCADIIQSLGYSNPDVVTDVGDIVLELTFTGRSNYYQEKLLSIKSPMARKVKIADILCNLADAPTEAQVKKYTEALSILIPRII